MSDFLERLTGVLHWFGFIISVFVAYLFFTETTDNPMWLSLVIILIPNTIGWLIKFVFTGNGKFFPF